MLPRPHPCAPFASFGASTTSARSFSRSSYFGALEHTCANLSCALFAMTLFMGGIAASYVLAEPGSGPTPLEAHERDDAVRWTIAIGGHFVASLLLHGVFRLRAAWQGRQLSHVPASPFAVTLGYAYFVCWFALWMATLTYLTIATKYSRVRAETDAVAASGLLQEHARATNNSMALIALVSLRSHRTISLPAHAFPHSSASMSAPSCICHRACPRHP